MSIRNRKSDQSTYVEQAATPEPRKLHFYHELDEWQKDNHYITSGYVKETSSFRKCFESLFYLNNETVNIYSHLLPSSVVLLGVALYVNTYLKIYDNYLGVWEKWNFVQFGAACTGCLLMSSMFHCTKSHSHKVSRIGNQLDYFGIVVLITCSLLSIVNFAFYDHPNYQRFFVVMFLVLGSGCTVMTLHPKFSTNVYRPARSAMFIVFGLSGVLPVIAAIRLFGYREACERANINWLYLEGFFYILGAVLYAMRIPECFSYVEQDEQSLLNNPIAGKWDIFGASHQIFHVMVVVAAYCHWRALLGCYHYLHQVILPAY